MRTRISALILAIGLSGAALAACDDDDSTTNKVDVGAPADTGTGADVPVTGTGGTSGVDATPGTGGTTGDNPDVPSMTDVGDGGAPDTDNPGTVGPTGCISTTPASNADFLNSCPPAGVHWEDKTPALPGGFTVGAALPPLQ